MTNPSFVDEGYLDPYQIEGGEGGRGRGEGGGRGRGASVDLSGGVDGVRFSSGAFVPAEAPPSPPLHVAPESDYVIARSKTAPTKKPNQAKARSPMETSVSTRTRTRTKDEDAGNSGDIKNETE